MSALELFEVWAVSVKIYQQSSTKYWLCRYTFIMLTWIISEQKKPKQFWQQSFFPALSYTNTGLIIRRTQSFRCNCLPFPPFFEKIYSTRWHSTDYLDQSTCTMIDLAAQNVVDQAMVDDSNQDSSDSISSNCVNVTNLPLGNHMCQPFRAQKNI
mgnify:CR=1 FL=1